MKKTVKDYVKNIGKLLSIGQQQVTDVDDRDESYRSVSKKELASFVTDVGLPGDNKKINVDSIPAMLEPISKELGDRKMDYAKLTALAPEIEQAASILVPSILSPNDFRKNNFSIIVDVDDEESNVLAKVNELLTEHFGERLDLETKLSSWVNDMLFKVGSKVILTLPTQVIPNLKGTSISLETFSKTISKVEKLDYSGDMCSSIREDEDFTNAVCSIEGLVPIFEKTDQTEVKQRKAIKKYTSSGIDKCVAKFDEMDMIGFTDNPLSMIQCDVDKVVSLEALDKNVLSKLNKSGNFVNLMKPDKSMKEIRFKDMKYIDIGDHTEGSNGMFPSLIELPSEAVIPITVEGSPSNHIGYFILLNGNGVPVSVETSSQEDFINSSAGTQRVDNMYQAFYGEAYSRIQRKMVTETKSTIINTVYDSYLTKLMDNKLESLGLDKYQINMQSDLSRVMFSRLLKKTKTKVLFVPKSLVSYMAFDYHDNGIGRSKIDNIKFPLSLKVTLIIARLINLIEGSINRRRLNVTLDDSIGNPLEILRTIKKQMASNNLQGISYDPTTIMKGMREKEITVVPNKIPGIESFEIVNEENNITYPRADSDTMDEINNMYTSTLGVPPSALNRLSEDEFSRSVATNNIFFSNQLRDYQKVLCSEVSRMARTYISFSEKLQKDIISILGEDKDNKAKTKKSRKAKKKVKATIKDGGDASTSDRLTNIINNIKLSLPSPTIAQDKAAFEELRNYIEILDNVLEKLYPEDLVADRDLADTVKVFRTYTKQMLLQEHLKTDSTFADIDFDALSDPDIVGMYESSQKFMNMKASIDALIKGVKPADGEDDGGGGGSQW